MTPAPDTFPPPDSAWAAIARAFAADCAVYWANLSRLAGLLTMLNVSLFFLHGAVSCGGAYWPLKSLLLLALLHLLLLLPHPGLRRLGVYLAHVATLLAAGAYFAASVVWWLRSG